MHGLAVDLLDTVLKAAIGALVSMLVSSAFKKNLIHGSGSPFK